MNTSRCRKCGLPLKFESKQGKLWPVNPDGSDHFGLCSETTTKKVQAEGVAFKDESGHGYEYAGTRHYMMRKGRSIKATDLSLPDCDCKTPPWEDCCHAQVEVLDEWQRSHINEILGGELA